MSDHKGLYGQNLNIQSRRISYRCEISYVKSYKLIPNTKLPDNRFTSEKLNPGISV